jgi:hypothetical protein
VSARALKPSPVLGARVPPELRARFETIAKQRFGTKTAALQAAVERLVEAEASPPASAAPAPRPRRRERLEVVRCRINRDQVRRIRTYAAAAGHAHLSDAMAELLGHAVDAHENRVSVPAARADELLEAVRGVAAIVDALGPGVLGLVRLLAHWAAKSGGLKVGEDELLAEIWSVGASEWAQLLEELGTDEPKVH